MPLKDCNPQICLISWSMEKCELILRYKNNLSTQNVFVSISWIYWEIAENFLSAETNLHQTI